jgi:tetratricopeptide (TPR) repeat protein
MKGRAFLSSYLELTAAALLASQGLSALPARPQAFEAFFQAQGAAAGKPRVAGSTSPKATSETRSRAKDYFEQARRLAAQGAGKDALTAVEQGLVLAPRSVEGLNVLGIIYDQQNKHEQSVAAFRKALQIDPRSTETLDNLGISYSTQRKFDLAEQAFRQTLRLDPGNRAADYNLGLILLAKGQAKEAVGILRRATPPDAATLLALAQAYLQTGRTEEGLLIANRLSRESPQDVRLHFSLGVMLASRKQYGPAAHEFESADALRPGTFEILHDLGQAYLRNKENAKAEQVLRRALELQPDSADTLYLLAQANSEQRKDLDALELLVRARKLVPKNTDIIFLMARLSMKQSFFEDAIQVLEEGVKIAPRRADLHAALGESYFTVGKVDKAIDEFKTLIQLDPAARSYAFMGLCYRHLGRFQEARKYLDQGLKLDPDNVACLFNLGFIENKQGNYPAAEKLLVQAIRVDPDYYDALFELGSVKMGQKKYAEAVPLLRRCARLSPSPSQAYYKLATAERNLHQAEAAQRDMKVFETLSKDPGSQSYPFQHLFDYLNQRVALSTQQKAQTDLRDLLAEVQRHPDRPRNLYLLAEAYLNLGQMEQARKAVAQLDELSGGDFRTALGVGVLLARFHLYPDAIQHFQDAVTADPSSDEAKYNLADAYFQTHEYAKALEILKQASVQAENDDAYLALLGDTYSHLGRTAEAVQIFQKAITRNPDNDQYYLLLALTQMRAGEVAAAGEALRQGMQHIADSGALYWGMGVLAVLHGDNRDAEAYLRKAVDLRPSRQSGYSALGIFYYETGQFAEARQTLQRYKELFPHGALDVSRIEQALDSSASRHQPNQVAELAPQARRQFLQAALALADQNQ